MNARRKEQPKQWTLAMMLIGARKATLVRSSKNGNKASFTTLLSQLPAHYLMAFISLSPLCARMIFFLFLFQLFRPRTRRAVFNGNWAFVICSTSAHPVGIYGVHHHPEGVSLTRNCDSYVIITKTIYKTFFKRFIRKLLLENRGFFFVWVPTLTLECKRGLFCGAFASRPSVCFFRRWWKSRQQNQNQDIRFVYSRSIVCMRLPDEL